MKLCQLVVLFRVDVVGLLFVYCLIGYLYDCGDVDLGDVEGFQGIDDFVGFDCLVQGDCYCGFFVIFGFIIVNVIVY